MFELCSRVLKDYVLKHTEIYSIKQSKQKQRNTSAAEGSSAEVADDDEE